ncbi:NmrA domain-containing protein [Mycena venus]|uniref:NmrA domain-containing protein n=1 Tax=Mycena venus TaxID=2733690 RepID=A0A8H6YU64_9AGAR|nr:NmrA domain-containing protein [Mycena venus]
MPSSRIVAVFGATGLQGSAVVERLLRDGTFTPRAISRDPESEASLKLKKQGVEVVKADSGDKASLLSALRGAEAIFAVTVPIFGPPGLAGGPSEITQGKNMIDAAKEAGAKFFVFSSLPSVNRVSGGKYSTVQHYDDKEIIEEYLKSSGLAHASLHLGGFTENLWIRNVLKKTPSGFNISIPKYSPTALQAFTWVGHDVSESTLAMLKSYTDPSKNISGKSYPVITATMSYTDLAAMIAKALKVEVTFTSKASSGSATFDEMFAALAEYNGLYTSTPVPNPDLVALGAKFGTMEEFMETEVKKRFRQ